METVGTRRLLLSRRELSPAGPRCGFGEPSALLSSGPVPAVVRFCWAPSAGDSDDLDPGEGLLGQASAKGLWFLGSVHRKGMILPLSGSVTSSSLELDGTVELLKDMQRWCRGEFEGRGLSKGG